VKKTGKSVNIRRKCEEIVAYCFGISR